MPWYGTWDLASWLIFPFVTCIAIMAMMLLKSQARMGWCAGDPRSEARTDPGLETLRQRFASGELTQHGYEEQQGLLLRD